MRGYSVSPIDVFWKPKTDLWTTEPKNTFSGQSYMIAVACLFVLWPNCVNKQRLPSHKNWAETKMNISCNSCHVFIHLISLFYTVELFVLLGPHVWLMFGWTKWTNYQNSEACGLCYVVRSAFRQRESESKYDDRLDKPYLLLLVFAILLQGSAIWCLVFFWVLGQLACGYTCQ